jgi:hypothetical protein
MKVKIISTLSLLFLIVFATAQDVNVDSLMQSVNMMSDPRATGRLPGTVGYEFVAEYVETKFKQYGLAPLPNGTFRQIVPLETNIISGPCEFHVIHYENGIIPSVLGESYSFRGFTGSGQMTTQTVFCGFGLSSAEYDDYANIDVTGKTVLIFKGNPSFGSGKTYEPFSIRSRAKTAKEHGAAAVIFIPIPGDIRSKPIGSVMCGEGEHFSNLPMLQIDTTLTKSLFEGSGYTYSQLYKIITENDKPHSLQLPSNVYINVEAEYHKQIDSYNIVGILKGNDPELNNEWILITAHLDHVGFQCDVIYPGANDNASGSAAVIELARLFSQKAPARSIIFALLTAEESGLHGAEFLANNLHIPAEKVVAAMNFDCIASGDSIQIGNGLSNPILYEACKQFDFENLMISRTWKGGGADLSPFHKKNIPGLYFVTYYSYQHLHLPSDTPETLNTELFRAIVALGFKTASSVAAGEYKREPIIP